MSYEGSLYSPSRFPAATGSAFGGVKVGTNITNTAGLISLVSGNVTGALGFTPENAANKNTASGYAGLDGSSLVIASQLTLASGGTRGAVIVGSNITNTTGTISLTSTNVTTALGFAPVNNGGGTMTGLLILSGDAVSALGAVTLQQMQAAQAGLGVKIGAKLATTAALAANTYNNGASGVGATLTATSVGTLTIDGVLTVLNDRILVKNEATPANNGIYKVTTAGAAGAAYVLTRVSDFDNTVVDSVSNFQYGAYVLIEQGTANQGIPYVFVGGVGTAVPGTTAINWTVFNVPNTGVTSLAVSGSGLSVSGSTGAVTLSFSSQTQNEFLASPDGSSGAPSFRAIVVGDLPATVVLTNQANTYTGASSKQTTVASSTTGAGLNLPHGAAPTAPVNGDIWTTSAGGLFVRINGATQNLGQGTVTSVALSITGPLYTVSGSPVTTTGTLTATIANQTQNTVFAGSNAGGSVAPTFRALVAADLPTATGAALGVAQGGTGITVTSGVFSVNTATIARVIRIVTAAGAVTCTAADDAVLINKTVGAATAVTLTTTPVTGDELTIKDAKGDAGTNVITVSPAAGTIDGQSSWAIDSNYGARTFVYNGTEWNII